jgi:hypothetical protein
VTRAPAVAAAAAVLLAACAGVSSRIDEHRALFDASTPEVQRSIRGGRIEVGFTKEQVYMALGRPDRVVERKTSVDARETWLYGVPQTPLLGFGLGVGGVGFVAAEPVDDPPDRAARLSVAFDNGQVVSIATRR